MLSHQHQELHCFELQKGNNYFVASLFKESILFNQQNNFQLHHLTITYRKKKEEKKQNTADIFIALF